MANPYRTKRGGRKHTTNFVNGVRQEANRYTSHTSTTARVDNTAMYYQVSDCKETVEEHLVPRQSVTDKQMLYIKANQRPIEGRMIDAGRVIMKDGITVLNPIPQGSIKTLKITRMSDKSLLIQGKPFADAWDSKQPIKRQTSKSKRIAHDPENTYGQQGDRRDTPVKLPFDL